MTFNQFYLSNGLSTSPEATALLRAAYVAGQREQYEYTQDLFMRLTHATIELQQTQDELRRLKSYVQYNLSM